MIGKIHKKKKKWIGEKLHGWLKFHLLELLWSQHDEYLQRILKDLLSSTATERGSYCEASWALLLCGAEPPTSFNRCHPLTSGCASGARNRGWVCFWAGPAGGVTCIGFKDELCWVQRLSPRGRASFPLCIFNWKKFPIELSWWVGPGRQRMVEIKLGQKHKNDIFRWAPTNPTERKI